MTSQGERIGAALARAVKGAAAKLKDGDAAPVMFRTNLRDVPKVEGLKRYFPNDYRPDPVLVHAVARKN